MSFRDGRDTAFCIATCGESAEDPKRKMEVLQKHWGDCKGQIAKSKNGNADSRGVKVQKRKKRGQKQGEKERGQNMKG